MSAAPGMHSEQQAQAYVDDLMVRAREQAARARAMADELGSLAVRGRSSDGRCEVTVGHSGGMVDLWLAPTLAQVSLDDVRRQVLEADAAARRSMSAEVAALAAAHYGAGSAAAEELADRFAELLEPAHPASAAAQAQAQAQAQTDADADAGAASRRAGVVR